MTKMDSVYSHFKNKLNQYWNSPTMTTWGVFLPRLIRLIIIAPLVLTRFPAGDIVFYYMLASVQSLFFMLNFGFNANFIRLLAYGMGGCSIYEIYGLNQKASSSNNKEPNWETVLEITAVMRKIFIKLSILGFVLILLIGSFFMNRPISFTTSSSSAWWVWGLFVITAPFSFFGFTYGAYLQGLNHIPLLRRAEAILGIISAFFSCILLLSGFSIYLVLAVKMILEMFILLFKRHLCLKVDEGRFREVNKIQYNQDVVKAVWPSAVKTGTGVLLTRGIGEFSIFCIAQFAQTPVLASYLLSFRYLMIVNQFSQAPFYSKLPKYYKLKAQGRIREQLNQCRKGMRLSYWVFIVCFMIMGIFANPILNFIGSNTDFADPLLWGLMGLSVLAERYGAMHLLMYTSTNHILNHIVGSGYAFIYILTCVIFIKSIGLHALPLAHLSGHVFFYGWYSAMHSYRSVNARFLNFEKSVFLPPAIFLTLYCAITLTLN